MNRLDGAIQLGGLAQFCQGQIRFLTEELAQLLAVARQNLGFAFAAVIPAGNVAGLAALLKEFFDHPQRNPETPGDFLAGAFVLVIGSQNPLSQIQRNGRLHVPTLSNPALNGYNLI